MLVLLQVIVVSLWKGYYYIKRVRPYTLLMNTYKHMYVQTLSLSSPTYTCVCIWSVCFSLCVGNCCLHLCSCRLLLLSFYDILWGQSVDCRNSMQVSCTIIIGQLLRFSFDQILKWLWWKTQLLPFNLNIFCLLLGRLKAMIICQHYGRKRDSLTKYPLKRSYIKMLTIEKARDFFKV